MQIQCLEKEATDLRREKQGLFSDLEAIKMEKKHLQVLLESALEDKKHMTDRINQFTIIGKWKNDNYLRLFYISFCLEF